MNTNIDIDSFSDFFYGNNLTINYIEDLKDGRTIVSFDERNYDFWSSNETIRGFKIGDNVDCIYALIDANYNKVWILEISFHNRTDEI
jgi:hypothetical protein